LEATLGVRAAERANDALSAAQVVVWAVKPQVLREAVLSALPYLGKPLHVSIAAGVVLKTSRSGRAHAVLLV